mmetsp:Transcript_20596/g.70027  ORF Transcript_20596/g.70027 Transcript_20596/m.70027 type:complete len:200 (-) Transcript_20596:84-683(-)
MLERGWWIEQTTVCPVRQRSRSVPTRERAVDESSPDVGSSRKRRAGAFTSSTAMAVRFLSPPETPRFIMSPILALETRSRPRSSMRRSTRSRRSASGVLCGRRSLALKRIVSRTVSALRRRSSWNTKPSLRLKALSMGLPSTRICPLTRLGSVRWASTLMRLVLPLPLGPMSASISPPERAPVTDERMARGSPVGVGTS